MNNLVHVSAADDDHDEDMAEDDVDVFGAEYNNNIVLIATIWLATACCTML